MVIDFFDNYESVQKLVFWFWLILELWKCSLEYFLVFKIYNLYSYNLIWKMLLTVLMNFRIKDYFEIWSTNGKFLICILRIVIFENRHDFLAKTEYKDFKVSIWNFVLQIQILFKEEMFPMKIFWKVQFKTWDFDFWFFGLY